MFKFDPSELTSEKSLWDIYRSCRRIRPSWVQTTINIIVFGLLGWNAFFLNPDTKILLIDVRAWSTNGFNFAITTLGFLIAGFTIFTTVAKPGMMLAMMDHQDKETKLPTLKKNFFAFMSVFIAYLACAGLYLIVILFGQPGGVISGLIKLIPYSGYARDAGIKMAYILVGGSFVYLLLMLKAFIFNVYAIVMNFLRWEYSQTENNQER